MSTFLLPTKLSLSNLLCGWNLKSAKILPLQKYHPWLPKLETTFPSHIIIFYHITLIYFIFFITLWNNFIHLFVYIVVLICRIYFIRIRLLSLLHYYFHRFGYTSPYLAHSCAIIFLEWMNNLQECAMGQVLYTTGGGRKWIDPYWTSFMC